VVTKTVSKYLFFVFRREKKAIQILKDMRVSKWWWIFIFGRPIPF